MTKDSDVNEQRRTFSGPEFRMDAKDIKTATDAVRARTWSVFRRGNFAGLARDVQVSVGDLEAFAKGEKAALPESVMHALVKQFFYYARFDPVADRLVDTSPAPLVFPPNCVPTPFPKQNVPTNYQPIGAASHPSSQTPSRPSAPWLKRPGFA